MIDYLLPHSPDLRIFERARNNLEAGKLISFPLESHWDLFCDPHIKSGVEEIYRYRDANKFKHFSLICSDLSMASQYAYITDNSFRLLKKVLPGPYTFILQAQKITTKWLKASKYDHQVGIRIPSIPWVRKLIEYYGRPLLSTHLIHDESQPLYSALIDEELSHLIAQIIDPGEIEFTSSTTVIDLSQDHHIEVIRQGAGDTHFLGLLK